MASRKGRKNLVRDGDTLTNQHGVTVTLDEKKALESLVAKANKKRAKMLDEASTLPRLIAGQPTGDTVGSLQLMGKESDFIVTKKTASLQRFTSRQQFDNYLNNLERVTQPNYVEERIRLYKRNFTNSLRNVYGWEESKDIIMKIRMMKPEDYMRMVESDETLEISYVPSDVRVEGRLNQIRAALGMKLKDEWYDEEYE